MQEESIFAIAQGGGGQFVESVVMQDRDAGSRFQKLQERPVVYYKTAQHQNSGQIADILNPVRGVRDQMRRDGKVPRNHARDNMMAIRNQSNQNKLQKQLDTKLPAQRKTFSNVSSSKYGRSPKRASSASRGSSKDFISQNKSALQGIKAKKLDKEPEQLFKEKENYGKLPRYLLQRKLQLAEEYEKRREGERMALAPPGTRIMPEDERLATLDMLQQNKAEVEKHLKHLPFVVETPSQVKAKTNLENRLKEIEEAERLFSRPIVYVKI